MVKNILKLILIVLIGFLGLASVQPDEFTVSRSATYSVPADKLFVKVNNLKEWNSWSPWAKIDPKATSSFEGPAEGVGAVMKWASDNSEVGTGSMTIIKSVPNQSVSFDLAFISPFEGESTTEFTFQPENDQTKVTWSMHGKKNFISKVMGLIFDCDKMVGGQFEKGLENLKNVI